MTGLVKKQELDLSVDLEFDEDPEHLPQALREGQNVAFDNEWAAHRVTSIKLSNKIEWSHPVSAKVRDEAKAKGTPLHTEVTQAHYITALRGIPLEFQYGAALVDGRDKDNFKPICNTTRAVEHLGEQSTDISNKQPLRFPFGQVHQSKKEPHTYSKSLDKDYLVLYGSRGPVGLAEGEAFSTPRTCKSCVEAGEHYLGTQEQLLDPNSGIPKCGMRGSVLFAVFEVGLLDTSGELDGEPSKINWVSIADARLRTMEGVEEGGKPVPLVRPFIIKLDGLSNVVHSPIGTGKFETNILNQPYQPDEIYSVGDYFEYLRDAKYRGQRSKVLKSTGDVVFPVITEIHAGEKFKIEYNATHMPVFHPVTTLDKLPADSPWKDALRLALQIRKLEVDVANGKASFESAPVVNLQETGSAPSLPEAAPKAVEQAMKKAEDKAEPVGKASSTVFAAFQSRGTVPAVEE